MVKKRNIATQGLANYQHPDIFGGWLGYKITKFDKKKSLVLAELKIRPDHLSPAGRVHGGVVSAFFDYVCGAAVFTTLKSKDFCSTVELKVNYFSPLDRNDILRARAVVQFRGNRLCVVHALAYRNNERKPAAMASATFNVVSY